MTFQEKQALVNLFSGAAITATYFGVRISRTLTENRELVNDPQYWGKITLVFIGISVIARILILILFNIVNKIATDEDDPGITDERDKLFDLKANRITGIVFSLGFVLAMALLAAGLPGYILPVCLILSGLLGDVAGEAMKFLYYRRGY